MNKIKIRFNKSRGQPGRGSIEHVWRVFEKEKEYLVKNVLILVNSETEKEEFSEDWNIVCYGNIEIDRDTSTITIVNYK